MGSLVSLYTRFTNRLNQIAIVVSELSIIGLMLCTCYAVVARYVFRSPSVYTTEICVYLLILATWFSVGYVHKVDRHVRVEIFENLFSKKLRIAANLISTLSIILFCLVLIWAGYLVAETAYLKTYRSTSILKFPLWITYALIPCGGVLLGLVAVNRLITADRQIIVDKNEVI